MKILQVHNKYQFAGGEDVVYDLEKKLLENHSHTAIRYERHNKEIEGYSLLRKGTLLWQTTWSKKSYAEITDLIVKENPDICHVHNTLPLITPSIYYACKNNNVPVVQTLHNYRLLCSNAYFFRNGKICEECLGKSLYHSVKYGCYRNSKLQIYALARMVEKHKKMGTWEDIIDGYICLTNFAKQKFIDGGIPKEKLFLKSNFLFENPGYSGSDNSYFFFAGRLDETKGINILIEAAKKLPNVKFKVAGDGPLKEKILTISNIEYLGLLNKNELIKYLKNSFLLIFPSIWYECMPMTILEAFACSKPVIGSNLGAMAELVDDGRTGLLFDTGNAEDLASKIRWANEHLKEIQQMGINARKVYEEKYTAEKNYTILMDIYKKVISNNRQIIN